MISLFSTHFSLHLQLPRRFLLHSLSSTHTLLLIIVIVIVDDTNISLAGVVLAHTADNVIIIFQIV